MSNSKSPQIAAAAALIMAAGNGGDAQAAQLMEQMNQRLQNKMEKYAAQKQKDDSAASFTEEAAKMGLEVNDSIPDQKTPSYTFTQDGTTVEDTYNNGKTKNSATINVSRAVDTVDPNAPIVSTTVRTDEEELSRRGKTTSTVTATANTLEKFSSFGGNSKQETNFSHTREFDRQGRLRSEETTRFQDTANEAGALDISHGYNAAHSYGNLQSQSAEFDAKGRTTSEKGHYEHHGSSSSVSDMQQNARRGADLEELSSENLKGLKNYTEAEAQKDGRNQAAAEVKTDRYDKNGKLKKSLWGRIREGASEIYGKFKQGRNKTQAVEVISEKGKTSGTKMVTRNDGTVKKTTLSDRAAIRHLKKLRNGVNENLERLTGAENMEEYAGRVTDVDQEKRMPLGQIFERHDQNKVNEARDNLDAENGKKLDQQKQISATDIMNHIVQAKLQKGE